MRFWGYIVGTVCLWLLSVNRLWLEYEISTVCYCDIIVFMVTLVLTHVAFTLIHSYSYVLHTKETAYSCSVKIEKAVKATTHTDLTFV